MTDTPKKADDSWVKRTVIKWAPHMACTSTSGALAELGLVGKIGPTGEMLEHPVCERLFKDKEFMARGIDAVIQGKRKEFFNFAKRVNKAVKLIKQIQGYEDVTFNMYFGAAQKNPALFYRTPETIAANAQTFSEMYRDGLFALTSGKTLAETVFAKSTALCLSNENLQLHKIFATARQARLSSTLPFTVLMNRTRGKVEMQMINILHGLAEDGSQLHGEHSYLEQVKGKPARVPRIPIIESVLIGHMLDAGFLTKGNVEEAINRAEKAAQKYTAAMVATLIAKKEVPNAIGNGKPKVNG